MDWNEFYAGVRRFAGRTAEKLNRTADMASLQVKLSMAEKKLNDAFLSLGRVAYSHFTSDNDESQRVASAVATIEHIKMEIHALEEQIKEARRQAEEAKQAEAPASEESVADESADAEAEAPAAPQKAPVEEISSVSDTGDAVEITVETDGDV